MSQCLSGVCLGLYVSMSQMAMSQCLNVSGGSAWASTERLNVSMSQLFRRGLPGPARSVSMSQLSRRGLPGPARRSQCLWAGGAEVGDRVAAVGCAVGCVGRGAGPGTSNAFPPGCSAPWAGSGSNKASSSSAVVAGQALRHGFT